MGHRRAKPGHKASDQSAELCVEQTQVLFWFPFQTQQVVGGSVCVCVLKKDREFRCHHFLGGLVLESRLDLQE